MAIGRSKYAPPYSSSTKGHSVLKQRSYALTPRTPPSTGLSSRAAYDTRAEEHFLADRVSDVNYLSNSLLDEGYDTALRSRGRDQQLLKEATNAIPRRSLRDTASLTSSSPPFGARRFPRRFGKARFRTNQSASLYGTSSPSEEKSLSTSELMASPGPAPLGSWRRYGHARSSSAGRSFLEDDDASPDTSPYPSRASSVGPSLSSDTMHFPRSYSRSRRRLPPFPVTSVSESQVLDRSSSNLWGQSVSPSRLSSFSSPTRSEYEPLTKEYEPDIKITSVPRRRQKVLASSRRPAGNYYERLLRKRSKRQGRFGPYYDVESIEGSDLSGVLSDVDSVDGTYDIDNDNESSIVSPSSSRYLSTSTALSPYSPFFVDQDTEYVPFKPSRPLLTKGLLEITPRENDDDNDDSECANSHLLPSPTTDLSLSRYLPSSLINAATSTSSSTLTGLPLRSVVPYNFSSSDDSLAVVPSSSSPSQQILDTLVSSAVQRAKAAIDNLAIPEYSGASLVLSVEGAGKTAEGKRVDFTYTPPPIPLYGRSLALNDKLLGIQPSSTIKPLDNFISGYIQRMGALRAELGRRWDRDDEKRTKYGLKPLDTSPRASSSTTSSYRYTPSYSYTPSSTYTPYRSSYTRSYTPSYTQSSGYVPVKDLTSDKLDHLPVTTFRRRQEDGKTQRLDVFSLGEFRPRLTSSTERAIKIPESATGGHQLSVLDKINIKVSAESYATPQSSVASRRVARGQSVGQRAASVPPRSLKPEVETAAKVTVTQAAPAPQARPIIVLPPPAPVLAPAPRMDRAMSVPPVAVGNDRRHRAQVAPVPMYEERRYRARAGSVPPPMAAASARRAYLPPPAPARAPLPTSELRAHKVPRRFLTRTGMRTAFSSLQGYNEKPDVVAQARATGVPYALPRPRPAPLAESLKGFPKVFVPSSERPSNRSKAAIIASKLEPDPIKRRRPRSEYAANKYRELRKETLERSSGGSPQSKSSGLYGSSVKSAQVRYSRRTEKSEDKPPSLLSWQHRLDSMVAPKDLIYEPSSLIRLKQRVKNAQAKLSEHRDMLDKYLPEGDPEAADVATSIRRKMAAMERRDPASYRRHHEEEKPSEEEPPRAASEE